MRKICFMLILAFASMVVGAQTTEYKLVKGDVATELQFAPFNLSVNDGDESFSTGPFAMPGLCLRFGLSEKVVLRATVEFNMWHDNYKRKIDDTSGYGNMTIRTGANTNKNRTTQFAVSPGIEYHFGKWERMSVFVGGEVGFGMEMTQGSSKEELTRDVYERDWYTGDYEWASTTKTESSLKTKNCERWGSNYNQNGTMFFKINLFAGMDFYVYKGLYLGVELGLGYKYTTYLNGTVTVTDSYKTTYADGRPDDSGGDKNETKLEDKRSDGDLAFRCNPMIRLGWKF